MPRVFINAGHDINLDSGALGEYKGNTVRECDIARGVSLLVQYYLEQAGVETKFMQDDNLDLVCFKSNFNSTDLFVSIHCNSCGSKLPRGTETYCYYLGGDSEKAAKCIQDQIVYSLFMIDRGVRTANFQVLRDTTSAAVLVEMGFLSNQEDTKLLIEKKDEFARAIARGITDYFTNEVQVDELD